ncbi:MAG TPA: uracil-DNA glycosylase [Candidatus Paceibacterota bacterium]|nr:uracil-DNA glycosylase [Candidatus Paceibacterota bacterium]
MEKANNRTELLRQIRDEVLHLENSPLYQERISNRVYPVIGEGNHYAKIMFVGEAPGRNEALTGRPFVGAAGKILDQLLASIGIPRNDVYITNIVKDRPPFNRDPQPEEIEFYAPFLDRQIEIIQPRIIATLGRFSMAYIMNKFGLGSELRPISQLHGKTFEIQASYGPVTVVPLYHPAVAIYNASSKTTLEQDIKALTAI